ncbi:hypothetical protein D3C86_1969050 [compost metagenome]
MQGPQALASTVAPTASRLSSSPSRWIVWWISSDPGLTMNGTAICAPTALACSAMSAAREMSS